MIMMIIIMTTLMIKSFIKLGKQRNFTCSSSRRVDALYLSRSNFWSVASEIVLTAFRRSFILTFNAFEFIDLFFTILTSESGKNFHMGFAFFFLPKPFLYCCLCQCWRCWPTCIEVRSFLDQKWLHFEELINMSKR